MNVIAMISATAEINKEITNSLVKKVEFHRTVQIVWDVVLLKFLLKENEVHNVLITIK